jgi:hypothetical protein
MRHEISSLMPHAPYRMPQSKKWSGSLSRILSSLPSEDHSSATRVAAVVEQPTRKLSTETGGSNASLFGLAPQGVYLAGTAHAVRGALLPHRFTLASFLRLASQDDRRSVLCCTFRRVAAPGCYPACCPWEFGLSSDPVKQWFGDPPSHSTRRC